jgi:excisionase family DNA binding protein
METSVDQRAYLSVSEVASELGVSAHTIRRRIAEGAIPAVKLGAGPNNALRIPRAGLNQWLWSDPDDEAA